MSMTWLASEMTRLGALSEKYMARAVSLKIEWGCQNIVLRRRKNNLLHPECLKFCSCTKHTFSWNLLDKVNPHAPASTSQGSAFPKKISTFANYNDIQNLFEQEESQRVCQNAINHLVNECDLVLACERFPSITIGDSPTVQLYNCSKENINQLLVNFKKYQSSSVQEKLIKPLRNSDEWSLVESFSSDSSPVEYCSRSDSSHAKNLQDDPKDDASSAEPVSTPRSISMDISTSIVMALDSSIKCIQSISSRHCQQLENCGFYTVRKLLHHFPRTYADLENARADNVDGQFLILVGVVISSRGIKARASFSFLVIVVCCELVTAKSSEWNNENCHFEDKKTIYLHLKKFFRGARFTHRPFLQALQSKYSVGDRVYVSGKVKKMQAKDHYEMREYTIDMLEPEEEAKSHIISRPYPIYPSKAGLRPGFLKDIITRTLKVIPPDIDPIPGNILKEFGLLNLHDAYHGIHCPRDKNEADLARRRLIFDEFFYLQLARLFQMLDAHGTRGEKESLLNKYRNHQMNAVPMDEWSVLTKKFLKAIPYKLTPSQVNAISEIIWDLKRPVPMNRLLQGDVGCGKTVVALLSCMEVIGYGFQAAFMVPTELLAVQHYEQCMSFLGNINEDQQKPSVALLTGSTSSKQAQIIRQGLQTGDIAMVIGTHSLIAEKIEFSALRIAVIDEQHRFGVIQRGKFNSKLYSASPSFNVTTMDESSSNKVYMAPHVLAISATPIPRTLALALYGDMSLTQITESVPGRSAVETFVIEGNEIGFEEVYQMMKDELVGGGKVYLVYPVIEESEKLPQLRAAVSDYEYISAKFVGYNCGLLHGKMKSEEKDETLKNFRSGDTHILLATQVIEIGIDVPDASMMVVMNADRFGIAQLHQLRGRVGRGEKKSRCIFLSSTAKTLDRLKVLEKPSDGFYLANIDLLVRGPGNLLGKKQSGHLPEFPIARLEIDGSILLEAHHAALNILGTSTDLESFPRLKAELSMRQPLCLLGD